MLRNWQGFNATWLEIKNRQTVVVMSLRPPGTIPVGLMDWRVFYAMRFNTLTAKINRQQLCVQPTENTINPSFIKLFNRFFESLKVIFPASISVLKISVEIEIFKQQWITAFA
ncbi:replication protein P [Arsenophonus endosymbiont of Aleurodicus floccissimus]|uniref:replication protein P n=1 Tax=Arsenophonus endosymbiont of Aleurodicus floccissimus TaxID=2152761 RepID=UPI000E6B478B|nr:replication protein P [Arsenophonus endosymbiont of Aleurodicus floccissimus]